MIRLLLCAVMLAACASSKPLVERAPSYFYRLQADYTVIETGEEISFDFVAGCGGIITHYSYTTPSRVSSVHPTMMYKATSNGGAIGIDTPIVCDDRSLADVPKNTYQPYLIWFPDVGDLSFGWGYATESAYESPRAEVVFRGAKVTKATEAEWRANREQLATEYEQVGAIPGPWGFSFSRGSAEERTRVQALGKGRGIADACQAFMRLPLDQSLIDEWFAKAPENTGRYWALSSEDENGFGFLKRIREHDVLINGEKFGRYHPGRIPQGTLTRSFLGHTSTGIPHKVYVELFPYLPRRESMSSDIDLSAPPEAYYQKLLVAPEFDGFSACRASFDPITRLVVMKKVPGTISDSVPDLDKSYDPDGYKKPHNFYLNDNKLDEMKTSHALFVLDREGYLYVKYGGWTTRVY